MFIEIGKPFGLRYNPLKACVVPRPIGWISSRASSGAVNLAPFSFFNMLTADPPMLIFCPNGSHVEGGWKDSLANVAETKEFVANMATWDLRHQVNMSSIDAGRAVDEMKLSELSPVPSNLVQAPGVKESPIRMECVLHDILELPRSTSGDTNHAVIGRVIGVTIEERVLTDGMVDMQKLQPIARLGYMDFAVVREVFQMQRPKSEQAGEAQPRRTQAG